MNTYYDPITNRTLNRRPQAFVLDAVFDEGTFSRLNNELSMLRETKVIPYERSLGRFGVNSMDKIDSTLSGYHEILLDKARSIFTPTLMPTYCLWVTYKGFRARLPRHVDDNACTYTIDLCVSHKTQWPIFVEEKEILLDANQAVCYYGEDQYHWRNDFPDPSNNEVQMIFFHFAEPEHWYFTKGPSHLHEIARARHEYQKRNGIQGL